MSTNSVLELPTLPGIVELDDLAASLCSGGRCGGRRRGRRRAGGEGGAGVEAPADSGFDSSSPFGGTITADGGQEGTFSVNPNGDGSGTFSIDVGGSTLTADFDNAVFS